MPVSIPFTQEYIRADDTAVLSRGKRNWVTTEEGLINSWEDFEKYPWPSADDVHYDDYEFVSKNLPEGMKMIASSGGMLEWVMWLMGFVPFAVGIYEQPDLIEALFDRICEIHVKVLDVVAGMPDVGAFFLGDDMGYKSGTFIKPEHMRRYVFPKQKKLAEITHKHGLPFLLHACGNLEAIMDDLIEDVGIDGRHSFEDVILPVGEAKRRYGKRVSILGGVDVDMLARSSEAQVRLYTRQVLEECMPGGGYALGTGNSVANYIPLPNYLAMLDEGMKVGMYS
jgi:uroporphyrinogen decarboxylase